MGYRTIESVEKWDQNGPNLVFTVGTGGVKEIGEHLPMGPGDVCYYDILFVDTKTIRMFHPDVVRYSAYVNIETPAAPKIITP